MEMGKKTAALIVAAGKGSRMGTAVSKQYLPIGGIPILIHTLQTFQRVQEVDDIVLVVGPDDVEHSRRLVDEFSLHKVRAVVAGGTERQHSVRLGLNALPKGTEWVLVHDGVRPLITREHIQQCIREVQLKDAVVSAVPVKDTIKQVDASGRITAGLDRNSLWAMHTPQAFRLELLLRSHERAEQEQYLGTDEAALVERIGHSVHVVRGDYRNIKITTPEDLPVAERFLEEIHGRRGESGTMIRVGQGYDVHQLVEGRPCIIGGVTIPFEKGLLGHSDADVLLHAISDAILGALALGDIGKHFPDTDPAFKDADSVKLLAHVWGLAREKGYKLGNLDGTIIAQRPKMAPHIPQMVEVIARTLQAEPDQINVKATTSEKLGFVGREEGIASQAVVCLIRDVL
jgi:2-C-methyl-D-erythritol 4-phosphate cytidylyltransferase/2-C-methyl-D-erythritol 2,4-cyclodiphosphate synthase